MKYIVSPRNSEPLHLQRIHIYICRMGELWIVDTVNEKLAGDTNSNEIKFGGILCFLRCSKFVFRSQIVSVFIFYNTSYTRGFRVNITST